MELRRGARDDKKSGHMTGRKGRAEHTRARFIEPMMCLAQFDVPAGSQWEYELKFDGYRGIAFKARGRVHLMSRNGKDCSKCFPHLTRVLEGAARNADGRGECAQRLA